ncbi:hypothetical protein LTR84_003624 [Exophiala bonariae]|uniref:Zinc finger PHD-type domain-containing protein n=1 Tax=Exophiala bonariae TaxID=1690606 RepID=A0AAV9N7X1_9EURO|nr:hypothetical protein LTR84_003624 [Exophiala bonariae]
MPRHPAKAESVSISDFPVQPRRGRRARREPERLIDRAATPSPTRRVRSSKRTSFVPNPWWIKVYEHLDEILKHAPPTSEYKADDDIASEYHVSIEDNTDDNEDASNQHVESNEPSESTELLKDDQTSSELEFSDGETPYDFNASHQDPVGKAPSSAWDSSSEDEASSAPKAPGEEGWCICKKYIEGTDFFGCDTPGCEIVWWHQQCVANEEYDESYVLQAEIEDARWICPACFPRLLRQTVLHTKGGDRRTQEEKVAEIDAKLREKGLWFLDDEVVPGINDREDLNGAAKSLVVIPAGQGPSEPTEHSSSPTASAAVEHPLSYVQPRHHSQTREVFLSVYKLRSLEESAQLWTSPRTVVTEGVEGKEDHLTIAYEHELVLPSMSEAAKDHVRFFCTEASRGIPSVDIPLALLRAVGADTSGFFPPPKPIPNVSSIFMLYGVDALVLKRVADFLRGRTLYVSLGSIDEPLTPKQKRRLVQYVHIAHVLRIECLIKLTMHALCASIIRRSEDWSETFTTKELLDEITVENSPARRVLLEGPGCMLPAISGRETLPCNPEHIQEISSLATKDSA